jgi:large subunit ribosomal protein L21
MTTKTQSYAIIAVGGKQYLVREGERLVVDRVVTEEGKTFHPGVLFVGGDGKGQLAPSTSVTARVVGHVRGEKVRIGKRRPKSGYRRQTGFRAALTQIEIESIGGGTKRDAATPKPTETRPADETSQQTVTSETAPQPPKGYADFTVAEIGEKAKRWKLEQLEAALAYENEHAQRKGAIAALEAAIEAKQEH